MTACMCCIAQLGRAARIRSAGSTEQGRLAHVCFWIFCCIIPSDQPPPPPPPPSPPPPPPPRSTGVTDGPLKLMLANFSRLSFTARPPTPTPTRLRPPAPSCPPALFFALLRLSAPAPAPLAIREPCVDTETPERLQTPPSLPLLTLHIPSHRPRHPHCEQPSYCRTTNTNYTYSPTRYYIDNQCADYYTPYGALSSRADLSRRSRAPLV